MDIRQFINRKLFLIAEV